MPTPAAQPALPPGNRTPTSSVRSGQQNHAPRQLSGAPRRHTTASEGSPAHGDRGELHAHLTGLPIALPRPEESHREPGYNN